VSARNVESRSQTQQAEFGPESRGVRVSPLRPLRPPPPPRRPPFPSSVLSAEGFAKAEGPAKAEPWQRRRHDRFSPGFTWFHLFSPNFTYFHFPAPGGPAMRPTKSLLKTVKFALSSIALASEEPLRGNSQIPPILHSAFLSPLHLSLVAPQRSHGATTPPPQEHLRPSASICGQFRTPLRLSALRRFRQRAFNFNAKATQPN
jgi:hypothetical protein